jgi:hypothetical protein
LSTNITFSTSIFKTSPSSIFCPNTQTTSDGVSVTGLTTTQNNLANQFTIEFFLYLLGTTGNRQYLVYANASNNMFIDSGGSLYATIISNTPGGSSVSLNTWHHIALSYETINSGTASVYYYLDGSLQGYVTGTAASFITSPMYFAYANQGYVYGYMDCIRISSIARYKLSDYRVPITPYVPDYYTVYINECSNTYSPLMDPGIIVASASSQSVAQNYNCAMSVTSSTYLSSISTIYFTFQSYIVSSSSGSFTLPSGVNLCTFAQITYLG